MTNEEKSRAEAEFARRAQNVTDADVEDVLRNRAIDRVFIPEISYEAREEKLRLWHKAVKCACGWAFER